MIGVGTFKTSPLARKYINQVLDTGRISYGPYTKQFERVFSIKHACEFGIMTSSGTCALMIALAALKTKYGWRDGDEVLVPSVTFIATSNVVLQLNMKPVFVDVESEFYGINPLLIEAAITERTRCIIPVHLFGMPCEMDSIMGIARAHDLKVIEDSCETMFAKYRGQYVGSFGEVGCFSTYVAHLLVSGVGGICTTNDRDLALNIRSIMNHGRDNIYIGMEDSLCKTDEELCEVVSKRFSFIQMGYSFRVTELEGALALAGMESVDEMLQSRKAIADTLTRGLQGLADSLQLPSIRPEADHSFMMYPVVVKSESKRGLVLHLEKHGIETRDMLPLINQPFYQSLFDIPVGRFPVADWIDNGGFYIGCHQNITESEVLYVIEKFYEYFT